MDGSLTEPAGSTRRFWLASPTTALAVGVLTLLLAVASVAFAVVETDFSLSYAVSTAVPLSFTCVGVVVARRQPRNAIGWLLLAPALASVGGTAAGSYVLLQYQAGYRGLPLVRPAMFLAPGWAWFLLLLPWPILLFPDGRLSSAATRRIAGVGLVACAAILAVILRASAPALYARNPPVNNNNGQVLYSSPGGLAAALDTALFVLFVGFCVAVVIRQVLAYRRSTGVYRQQLKWLMSGGAIAIIGELITVTTNTWYPLPAVIALPVSIGIGVLRYRLYEIDRLISRTLSYAILTALLVVTFTGLIALTTNTFALSGQVGVAASTLAAAALFNPLRKRVQRLVDRRFNRLHYDAEAIVAAFSAKLRDAVEIDAIRADLLDAVNRAVQPSHASVWIRPGVRR